MGADSAAIWARPGRQTEHPFSRSVKHGPSRLERMLVLAGLTAIVALNVALPSWGIAGYPVRGIAAVGLLLLLSILYADRLGEVMRQFRPLILVAVTLAIVGTFVSVLAGAAVAEIAEALLEVHLQVLVTLILAGLVARICGTKACVLVLVGVIGVSAAFAVLQMLGVDSAWHARQWLGSLQAQAREVSQFEKARPTGLSYSPITLSTQLCLAFAAYAAWRESRRIESGLPKVQDPAIIIAIVVFVVTCVASQTRSPVAGALIFFAIYSVTRRGSLVPVLLCASAGMLYFLWPSLVAIIQSPNPRITRVDDDTVWNRLTLATYGFQLFLENPLGYGFTFKPFDLWADHWRDLYALPGANAVRSKELHNYFLNMLNTYGIGLLLIAPLVVSMLVRSKLWLIFFVPYIFHITFHNTGPFWNDAIVWFAIAALSASAGASAAPQFALGRRVAQPSAQLRSNLPIKGLPADEEPEQAEAKPARFVRPFRKRFQS